ncbi:hypothetical protein [Anaerovorax sp. IOR16]|uniref:hypothetical protein n=1 Tax=Anaerovorax sp. IOR16 TaxID=2773458 RepID=UPI0019D09471|nr:hypothetical protein [Anaerovorax sp. IOR16]
MKKHIYAVFITIFVILCMVGCGKTKEVVSVPEYEIETEEDYGIALKNHSWRVIIEDEVSDEQLLLIFDEVDKNKYEETTMWVYSSSEAIKAGAYDVAMVERVGKEPPTITR